MSVIVTDSGFTADTFEGSTVDLPSDTKPDALADLIKGAEMVRWSSAFSDGRGFTSRGSCAPRVWRASARERPCDRRSICDGAALGL